MDMLRRSSLVQLKSSIPVSIKVLLLDFKQVGNKGNIGDIITISTNYFCLFVLS